MKVSEFEEKWNARPYGLDHVVAEALGSKTFRVNVLILAGQRRDQSRYTEKLMEVCGVEVYDAICDFTDKTDMVLIKEMIEKIACATPEQRLKAAGLTGCDDD